MTGIDMTPSDRITREMSEEEIVYEIGLSRQFNEVDRCIGLMKLGMNQYRLELDRSVIELAKQIQWEIGTAIGSICKGTVN